MYRYHNKHFVVSVAHFLEPEYQEKPFYRQSTVVATLGKKVAAMESTICTAIVAIFLLAAANAVLSR